METKFLFKYLKKLPGKWFLAIIAFIWVLSAVLRPKIRSVNVINYCIVLTAIIIAVWLVYLLMKWVLGKKKGKEKETEGVVVAGLEERLSKAAESSRNVPWYLVIGPSGSGKTSMLRKSELDFSYVDSLQENPVAMGIEQTKNCDLFFTKEAVILDTSGRYVDFCNEAQISTEFLSILSLVKKLRKQNPIAGLVVPVDISRFLQSSQEAAEKEAKNIRYCIDEIISELQVKLPVYLVFTKCDLIYGFAQFFGDLNSDERMQTWGSILRDNQTEKPEAAFSDECKQLAHVLMANRDPELGLAKRQDRGAVYTFPLEFESVHQKLAGFVGILFQSISREKPVFRGFHFTSSVQEESPEVSFVMQSVAESINRQPSPPKERVSEGGKESKCYFIRDLFRKAIFSDRDLYAPTKAAQRRSMIVRLSACAVILLILLTLTTILTVSYFRNKGVIGNTQTTAVSISRMEDSASEFDKTQDLEKLREYIVRLEGFSLLWGKQERDAANAARRFYLLKKYGSTRGWDVKLSREVRIPVKVVKYEEGKAINIDESVEIKVQEQVSRGATERTIDTDKNGSATFKAKIADGKAKFVFSTYYEPIGYERQRPQVYEIQPGELESSREVRFIFSTSGRTITVRCKDQFGKDLSEVPVSIVEKTGALEKPEPKISDEQGMAQFSVDAPENTVFLVYCDDSDTNYEAEKPYEITIESGKSDYLVEPQIRRKIEIHVIASTITADGASQLPKAGVLVSVGKAKLGQTNNDGEWKGPGDIIPDQDNVTAEPIPGKFRVEKTASVYSIMLEYAPGVPKPVEPEPEPKDEPEPLPSLKFAADPQLQASEIEVWMYVADGETDGLKFVDEIDFESAGKKLRLVRLDPKVNSKGLLELPEEVEGKKLLLYHQDYWPQEITWQQTEEQIEMVSIKQERSFKNFEDKEVGSEHFYELARKSYAEKKYKESAEYYQHAIRLVPRSRYYLGIGWAYKSNGQRDESAKNTHRGLEVKLLDDPDERAATKEELQELLELLLKP